MPRIGSLDLGLWGGQLCQRYGVSAKPRRVFFVAIVDELIISTYIIRLYLNYKFA